MSDTTTSDTTRQRGRPRGFVNLWRPHGKTEELLDAIRAVLDEYSAAPADHPAAVVLPPCRKSRLRQDGARL